MKLLFRQRAFSWFDSYDIYDENENTVYVVKGQLSWGRWPVWAQSSSPSRSCWRG